MPPFHQRPFLARQIRRARNVMGWAREGRLLHELGRRRGYFLSRVEFVWERGLRLVGLGRNMRDRLGLPRKPRLPDPAKLVLPTSDAPVLSVVIPAYGQVPHTLLCLASLAAHPPSLPFEVIVAEDASGDPKVPRLRAVRGLRYLERTENAGFLRSANDAMAQARGRFLFLLNNDTEVMPGALDRLVATLEEEHPAFPGRVGLAGARLLYPEGWLQEAGGIVWRDASAWNWGNRRDPRRPEFNYLREADYVSGAAMLIRREAWEEAGGFDEHFLPAYCEDSDLCFRLRALGWRTLYEPRALVIHHEGASHGTDETQGVKAYQVTNRAKLLERHAAALAAHEPNGANILRARDRAPEGGARKAVLVVDHMVPTPDQDAGSRTLRAFLLALLADGHAVKFRPVNGQATPGYAEALEALGVEVLAGPLFGRFEEWLAAEGAQLDRVLVSRPAVAEEVLPLLGRHVPSASVVFYGHDLHHARLRAEARAADPTRAAALEAEADEWEAMERAAWAGSGAVLYPSEEEAEAVRRLAPGTPARAIVPYALPEPGPLPEPAGREGIVFVAGFAHPPNVDAARWLVEEVLPLLHRARPGLRLALVGSHPTPEVQRLASPLVEVTGFVPDEELARRYAAARVAICPLRFGAGVKMKVVEALHQAVPLVTTPVGVQGLTGAPCAVADTAEALAEATLLLLSDDAAWRRVAEAQRDFVSGRYTAGAMRRALEEAFRAAEARPAARA